MWVDLLTQREFEAGFGSHTPMFSGQTKCVRYYMNAARALALAKECLLQVGDCGVVRVVVMVMALSWCLVGNTVQARAACIKG